MKLTMIHNARELSELVQEIGMLPFFRCNILGFSLEEYTPPGRWFVEGVEGPWQWREQIAADGKIAYAKLFHKKAGFVSMEWYPDLCNYRRDGYDFDARYEDGMATYKSKRIMDALAEHGPLLSTDLKRLAGFGRDGEKGFETTMTNLQMQTYLTVREFVYKRDRHGNPYGWGVGRYILSEDWLGEYVTTAYGREPLQSKEKLLRQIAQICPHAEAKEIVRLIR